MYVCIVHRANRLGSSTNFKGSIQNCFVLRWTNRDCAHSFVLRVNPNVSNGLLFSCILIPYVFCAWSRPTNKRNREQKHITKKLLSFQTSSFYQLWCMYVCMYACMHAYIHTYIHAYIYKYVYIYNHPTYLDRQKLHAKKYTHCSYTFVIWKFQFSKISFEIISKLNIKGFSWPQSEK